MNIFDIENSLDIESIELEQTGSYGIYSNGLFKTTTNQIGTYVYKVCDLPNDLPIEKNCEVSFIRNDEIPKIPYQIFQSMVQFFRDVKEDIKSEVYCIIVWDKIKKDFFLHVPVQKVSGATVSYENTPEIYKNADYLVYCDFHSHVDMNAYFSSTDTKDEVAGRYFGVLGQLSQNQPQMALKASFNRQGVSLEYNDLFDINTEKLHEDSNYFLNYNELKSRITENVPTYPKITSMYSFPKTSSLKLNTKKESYNIYSDYDPYTGISQETLDGLEELDYYNDIIDYTGTVFEFYPNDLTTFNYDFIKVFSTDLNTYSNPDDLNNLFNSLLDLVLRYKKIEENDFDEIISKLKLNYSIDITQQRDLSYDK